MKKILATITVFAVIFASLTAAGAASDGGGRVENKSAYSDVKNTDEYFDSIMLLSKLDVMGGYEDGTFRPDNLVTRAEFSKLIITALGSAESAIAESVQGCDTIFSDVTGSHWAAGYISAAAANGIINGMGDGTFAPEGNITYAQAMKMLVCAVGYEQWSVDRGGWPDGYMYWGNQIKIGSGIKDIADSAKITRAQAASMIDNTLRASVCVNTHDYTVDIYGNKYAHFELKDGTGENFQTILTSNYDIYEVKGYMTGSVFVITSARNFDYNYYEENSSKRIDIHTGYGKDNADKNATAFIKLEENGDYTLVYMY